jgi:hypothetical protein
MLKPLLRFPQGAFAAVDPCCRNADLAALLEGTCGRAYGVARDKRVLEELRGCFHRLVLGPWEHAQVARGAFSLLYLAPAESHRMWLRQAWRCLVPGGVLVFVAPPEALDGPTVGFVCDRFSRVVAGAVPGGVAVLGARRPKLRGDLKAERALREAVQEARPLPQDAALAVPDSDPEVRPFVPGSLTAAEARELAGSSPLWRLFRESRASGLGRPPVPLHAGHVALLLAAGHLDGAVGEGGDRHLVRGAVEKTVLPVEAEDNRGHELHVHRPMVSVLLPGGTLKVLR